MRLFYGGSLTLTEKEFQLLQTQVELFHDDAKPLEISFCVYEDGVVQWELLRPNYDVGIECYDIVCEGALSKTE